MRALPLTIFIVGPLLLGTAAPVALGKSVSHLQPSASISSFWTGRIRSTGQSTIARTRSIQKKPIARSALIKRTTGHAIRAELITGSVSSGTASSTSRFPDLPTSPSSDILPVLKQDDIRPLDQILLNEVLRNMPEQCWDDLKSFYVRYDNSGPRGVAGKESVVMQRSNINDQEFRALFVHEFGHVLDLGCLQGNPSTGASEFKDGNDLMWNDDPSLLFYRISWVSHNVQKEGMKPEEFVTGYASWDVFEDLSESLVYYVFQRKAFEKRAQTNAKIAMKLAWIETYVFPGGKTIAEGTHQWTGEVPWDSTKLAYTWTK